MRRRVHPQRKPSRRRRSQIGSRTCRPTHCSTPRSTGARDDRQPPALVRELCASRLLPGGIAWIPPRHARSAGSWVRPGRRFFRRPSRRRTRRSIRARRRRTTSRAAAGSDQSAHPRGTARSATAGAGEEDPRGSPRPVRAGASRRPGAFREGNRGSPRSHTRGAAAGSATVLRRFCRSTRTARPRRTRRTAMTPMMTTRTRATTTLLVAGIIVTLAATGTVHLTSQRRDADIAIDGRYDDWYGSLQPLGDAPVSVQALNDDTYLYLRLTASDPSTRMEIVRRGFTVWFDPAGGTKKKLGIRYPVVEEGAGASEEGHGRGGRGRRGGEHPAGDTEQRDDIHVSDRVDILGPGKDDARSLTREHLPGLAVALHLQEGVLQYELRVPLARTTEQPYGLETQGGKTIGVGFETGKMPSHSSPQGGRGGGFGGGGGSGGRGGGMGHAGGGMGHGGGGGGAEEQGGQPRKPLKAWATIAIAPPAR